MASISVMCQLQLFDEFMGNGNSEPKVQFFCNAANVGFAIWLIGNRSHIWLKPFTKFLK